MLDQVYIWPKEALHQAFPLLAEKVGYRKTAKTCISPLVYEDKDINAWLEQVGIQLKLQLQSIDIPYIHIKGLLSQGGPAVLPLSADSSEFILLSGSRRGKINLLGRDKKWHKVPLAEVRSMLTNELEAPLVSDIDEMLVALNLPAKKNQHVRQKLLDDQLSHTLIQSGWLLRLSSSDHFWKQLLHARFPRQIGGLLLSTLITQGLLVLTWAILGDKLIEGDTDQIELQLWSLLMFTSIPFLLFSMSAKNRLALNFGYLLRGRLLQGILQLKPEEMRRQGSGQFMSYLMDIELLEAMSLSMALMGLIALIQILVASSVLVIGMGGWGHAALLFLWLGIMGFFSYRYYRRIADWLSHYRVMSRDLAERMVGHRTRLVQEKNTRCHQEEDRLMADYAELSDQLDHAKSILDGPMGRRGWLMLGLFWLVINLGASPDIGSLAISLGAVLLAASGIESLTQSMRHMLTAKISWEQLRPLYLSATREYQEKTPEFKPLMQLPLDNEPLITLDQVNFSYGDRHILKDCDLHIYPREHILLEGASGSGKSTLAFLLAGLRDPQDGKITLGGKRMAKLGKAAWRKQVVIAPQFHENHIFTETLAFNLLIGRSWPPSQQDLTTAENVCRALKLGELIDTMPAGLQQMVGESGWRLSHGERSRVFIARTLLQQADLIILDESFAALDPDTLKTVLRYVLSQRHALLLIAHP